MYLSRVPPLVRAVTNLDPGLRGVIYVFSVWRLIVPLSSAEQKRRWRPMEKKINPEVRAAQHKSILTRQFLVTRPCLLIGFFSWNDATRL